MNNASSATPPPAESNMSALRVWALSRSKWVSRRFLNSVVTGGRLARKSLPYIVVVFSCEFSSEKDIHFWTTTSGIACTLVASPRLCYSGFDFVAPLSSIWRENHLIARYKCVFFIWWGISTRLTHNKRSSPRLETLQRTSLFQWCVPIPPGA